MKKYQEGVSIPIVLVVITLFAIGLGSYIFTNYQVKSPITKQVDNTLVTTTDSVIKAKVKNSEANTNDQILFNYADGDYTEKYDDFNFDRLIDRVVVDKNSNDAYRGSPHKNIYVQTNSGSYVLSPELTELINGEGYFVVNKTRKLIVTYGAGSCCTHYGSEYIVVPNIGLKEVYKISEESGSRGDVAEGKIKITIEHLINYDFTGEKIRDGEWKKDVKILDLETYKYFDPFLNQQD